MKIYEIDQAIEDLIANSIDEETGEVLFDPEVLEQLQMERERKIENLALYIKNATAEAKAIKDERDALGKRHDSLQKRIASAKEYLEFVLHGDKFHTARVAVSYRKSTSVDLDDQFIEWAKANWSELLRTKVEPDKKLIGEHLKNGEDVPHAQIVTNTTLSIK